MPPGTRDILADQTQWAIAYSSMISTTFLFALDNTIVHLPSLPSPQVQALTTKHQVADIQPAILHEFGQIALLP